MELSAVVVDSIVVVGALIGRTLLHSLCDLLIFCDIMEMTIKMQLTLCCMSNFLDNAHESSNEALTQLTDDMTMPTH